MARSHVCVVLHARLARLQVDQARALLAMGVSTAEADAEVASTEFVVVLGRWRDVVVKTASGTTAEHGCTCLVDTLVVLGVSNIPLLVVVVGGARDDLGVRGVDRAASLASIRLYSDRSSGRFRTGRHWILRARLV